MWTYLHLLFRSKIYDSSIYNYITNLYGIMKRMRQDAFLADLSLTPSKKNYPLKVITDFRQVAP